MQNFSYIYQLPVPRLTASDPRFAPIVQRAARLVCTTPEYDALAAEVGLGDHSAGATDADERARLRAELDGMVAHLYELSESELTHILATFPLVSQATKDAVLTEYRRLAPHPDDAQLAALITAGESERVEFKQIFAKDKVARSVAGFLNSREGGTLLIGVSDSGAISGLAADYVAVNAIKPGRDAYQLHLQAALADWLKGPWHDGCTIRFHSINDNDVCRISVRPAAAPVFDKQGNLVVRVGNQTRQLSAHEALEYSKQRWLL